MIDPARTSRSAEEGPGREENLNRGLAFSQGIRGGRWGNAAQDYMRSGIPFQPSKRGAEGRWLCAPFSPKCPHTRKEQISKATMKLRLG